MERTFCDICGEEIYKSDITRRFKLKEYGRGLELGWTRLTVHNRCWKDLSRLIRERMKENQGRNT